MNAKELASLLTHDMRTSPNPSWNRLRSFLRKKGIDFNHAAMATRFPESQGDFGVLVTRDGRAFTFTFSPGPGDMRQQRQDVQITRWLERSGAEGRFSYNQEIAAALDVLREEAIEG